jgi:hypothetical protein
MRTVKTVLTFALLAAPAAAAAQALQPTTRRAVPAQLAAPPLTPPPGLDVLKGRPDTPGGDEATLGEWFDSVAAGIKFRPPAGMKRAARGSSAAENVARYTDADEKRGWVFVASRQAFDQPLTISAQTGAPGAPAGLLELTRDQLKANIPGAEIVREDVINVGDYTVAMLAARYTVGIKRVLSQQAIVRADDRLYYTLSLTTPAARQSEDGTTPEGDPGESQAVETFRAVVDTVGLLDRTPVLDDQRLRLFRTRALYVNLSPTKLRKALELADAAEPDAKTRGDAKAEHYYRIQRDGKDVGYTYVIENEEKRGALEGVSVGIRSRIIGAADATTQPAAGAKAAAGGASVTTDSESIMWMTFDRKHETWRTITAVDDGKNKDHATEIGATDRQTERALDRDLPLGEKGDERNPPVRQEDVYTLSVTTASTKVSPEPVTQQLPPFYLPQALGHLLPRLLPLNDPKTYMFASYVSDGRAVMTRYVDVERERGVTLGGRKLSAIPVRDRIGLEGSVTTHWMSPEGTYLGSTNDDTKMAILPSDEPTLRKIWVDAKLTAPAPAPAPAPAGVPRGDGRGNLQSPPAGGR